MTIVWASGGGAVGAAPAVSRRLAQALSSALDARVVLVSYRFAAEQIYPDGLTDVYRAVQTAQVESEARGSIVAVGGDRIGAAMAVSSTQLARRYREPTVDLQVLLAPILDVRMLSPSWTRDRSGTVRAMLDGALTATAPGLDRADTLLSPLLAADHQDTPPTIIITTEQDPFRDDGERYARALRTEGVPVFGHRYSNIDHHIACDGGTSAGGQRVLSGLSSALSAVLTLRDEAAVRSSSRQNDASSDPRG